MKIEDARYPLLSGVEYDTLTPMMRQYFDIKKDYLDHILFYRLGDFYEMFFDDALKASPILEITLTSRGNTKTGKIPMCGVPFHAVDGYLKKAIQAGISIAICEQGEVEGKGIVKREVIRIITPGTVYNSELLDSKDNNFVASVYRIEEDGSDLEPVSGRRFSREGTKSSSRDLFEFSYADISTGLHRKARLRKDDLYSEIRKLAPSEIIYFSDNLSTDFVALIGATTDLCRIGNFSNDPTRMLENYISYTAKLPTTHLLKAEDYSPQENMLIDSGSVRNLELTETMIGRKRKGSLLGAIDYTKTAMGARLLKQSIKAPLLDVEKITRRQDFVDFMFVNYWERSSVRELLAEIYDIERIVTKLVYNTISYRDLVSIKNSLLAIADIKQLIKGFDYLIDPLEPLPEISERIDRAIMDTGEGVKDGYSAELDEQREYLRGGKKWILELEKKEKDATGIRTLKVKYNKVHGYYIEVSKSFMDKVPEHYVRRQTLVSSERYVTEELKELEEKVLSASDRADILEKAIFEDIKKELSAVVETLKSDATYIAEIDMLVSFAELAYVSDYIRPVVDNSDVLNIVGGRHAVIETITDFIPNDTHMNSKDEKLFILTGPNMAGKSSYLRQNAIIILLAQMGSFVPAKSAHIGICDRIFTRVGASDDLAEGRSTFMVEMKELAYILENQTDKSFIILDEIGRGTSTFDGLSIALAVAWYLSGKRAKTMFATHYHEMTELEGRLSGVLNYRIEVKKQGEDIVFLRKIFRGSESKSYGIEVARLAGVSDEVVAKARAILSVLSEDKGHISAVLDAIGEFFDGQDRVLQGDTIYSIDETDLASDIVGEEKQSSGTADSGSANEIVAELQNLNMDELSPIIAWQTLQELVEKSKK